jgi:hypothetical protein
MGTTGIGRPSDYHATESPGDRCMEPLHEIALEDVAPPNSWVAPRSGIPARLRIALVGGRPIESGTLVNC